MAQKSAQWPPYVRAAPWLLIVGGLVWNSLDPSDYWGDPLLAAAAVLSGALLTLHDTVAVGVANVTGILVLALRDGSIGTQDGYLELVNTAFAALLGVGVNRVVVRHGRRLARVRSVAEAAQRAVLPEPPGRVAGLEVAACYRAAQDEALIGGDAYALQATPHGVRVLMADVRGKGLNAVGAVSVLLGAFREDAHREPDLRALADALERTLVRESVALGEEIRLEGFITALLVEFPPGEAVARTLDCGHPGPYLLGEDGPTVSRWDAADPGLPLGMGVLGVARPEVESRAFPPGCTLLLVTDGVTEARDAAGEFYDPVQGLAPLGPFAGAREAVDALVADVARWTGGPRDDDMAVLAVTRRGEPTGAGPATAAGGGPPV
ncbi:PP2C family protein-serine/threonine phosphatase [Kitasatospora sp. NPDC059648]|uniref:PP2C family protein-serine/threonine phosphatase n=1 Tax=Kitasatospora sp. NPDC059648 TaxID=3346894 RepID=UPI003676993D